MKRVQITYVNRRVRLPPLLETLSRHLQIGGALSLSLIRLIPCNVAPKHNSRESPEVLCVMRIVGTCPHSPNDNPQPSLNHSIPSIMFDTTLHA